MKQQYDEKYEKAKKQNWDKLSLWKKLKGIFGYRAWQIGQFFLFDHPTLAFILIAVISTILAVYLLSAIPQENSISEWGATKLPDATLGDLMLIAFFVGMLARGGK